MAEFELEVIYLMHGFLVINYMSPPTVKLMEIVLFFLF